MWRKSFQIIGIVAALMSLLPLLAADYWWIRVFDFPHLQFTGFTLLAIILFFFTFKPKWVNDYFYILILLGCFAFQFYRFIDYTPFVSTEVSESSDDITQEDIVSVYNVNLLQENKESEALIEEIKSKQPDIIVFTEANQRWKETIESSLGNSYAYKIEQPQENTYGMLLYSKMELIDGAIKFRVDPKIPSIQAKVKMRNGDLFQLYAIHPTPPMPQHNPKSTDRDKELMQIALESYEANLPVVVMGDFNDVAWSDSTQLTKTVGKLLDVRIGRGFYNTYHAKYPIFRWSLDHILTSSEFRLKDNGTGVSFGSDHFPYWAVLSFEPELSKEQTPEEPSQEDLDRAKEQMNRSKKENVADNSK